MESSSNTNVLYTSLPLGPMQVNSMLDLTSSDFLVFFCGSYVQHQLLFPSFQCSLMFLLKLSSCRGLNLFIPDWLSLLNLNFLFWHHVKIFSGLSKKAFSLRAIFECSPMQPWYNIYPKQFIQVIDYRQEMMITWHCDTLQTRQWHRKYKTQIRTLNW